MTFISTDEQFCEQSRTFNFNRLLIVEFILPVNTAYQRRALLTPHSLSFIQKQSKNFCKAFNLVESREVPDILLVAQYQQKFKNNVPSLM